jgi:glutamate carboxypeptidase
MSELQRLDKEIKALAQKTIVPGTKVTIEGGITGQTMEKTPKSAQVIDMYKNIVKREYKEEVVEWIAGGMTVGYTTAKFIPTIDALGVEADPMLEHTEKEVVFLDTFIPRTVSLIELIDELSAKSR